MRTIQSFPGPRIVLHLPLLAALVVCSLPAAAQEELRVYSGTLAEAPELPLTLPELTLQPPFNDDVESYSLPVPYTTTGISVVATTSSLLAIQQFLGAEGQAADGSELSVKGWEFSRTMGSPFERRLGIADLEQGAILSFDNLPAGDNTLRFGFGPGLGFPSNQIYTIVVTRAAAVSRSTVLTALGLSPGELHPPFASNTRAYEADVPGAVASITVTATPTPGGRVAISGRSSEGHPLEMGGRLLSGLTPGVNRMTVGVTAEDGSTYAEYSVAVRRDTPTGSAALHDLQFSEGRPAPGFMVSATDGVLPAGTSIPTPPFRPRSMSLIGRMLQALREMLVSPEEVTTYALDVSDSLLTIRARAAGGSSFEAAGTTADGAPLEVINQFSIDGPSNSAFFSVTLGELTAGVNTITLTLTDGDESVVPTTTTVRVTRTTGR